MPPATLPLPSAAGGTEELFEARPTPWREQPLEDFEAEASDGPAPVSYAPPRLLPLQPDVEVSQRTRAVLTTLQSWEGVVLDVEDDAFRARLINVTGDNVDEEVTLAIDELCDFDLELLEPGAIFYWSIGYRQELRGARERVSRIRFRRLPAWTESQLREAEARAATLARELGW
jgi:hypothetical protein